MEIDNLLSLVAHTNQHTIVDAGSLPVSRVHVAFLGGSPVLDNRQINLRSVEYAWENMRAIAERGQSDIVSMFDYDVSGTLWSWQLGPHHAKLSNIFKSVGSLTSGRVGDMKMEPGLLVDLVNATIANVLSEVQRCELSTTGYTAIDKINSTLDRLFAMLVETGQLNTVVVGSFCSLPLGEYGLVFSMAMLTQAVWSELRKMRDDLPKRQMKASTCVRVREAFNGNFTPQTMAKLAKNLLDVSYSPRIALGAMLMMLWIKVAPESHVLNGTITERKFASLGVLVHEYIGSPATMEDLYNLLAAPSILDCHINHGVFGSILAEINLANFDVTNLLHLSQ